MCITTRYGALTAALLMAVLLLTGCEEATRTPNNPTPAPEDTPRPPMGKPTDPKPAHGATGVSLDTVLKWSAAEDTTGYVVYFGTDPTPDGNELIGGQAKTSFDPEGLAYDTIYYWRVDSKNEIGTITGDVWRFRTKATPPSKPAKATNPGPTHEAIGVSRTTNLSWDPTPDATSYQVYFGTASSPGSNELHGDDGEQTGITFEPDTTLEYGTTYYWRIDTRNAGGATTGDVWSFTTEVQPPPKTTGPEPEDGATNVPIHHDPEWDDAPGATGYIVYFGTAPSLGSAERHEQSGTRFDANLKYGTTYYWRVDSKNDGGTTTGDVWSFTTVSPPASS
ncbi:MAG: hypothetical protein OXC29_20550 [Rhodococcus sp.]|nr:hypothetical protein [Rhodococcus sp. (in: high G+C Gram-positive bacteria)]